MSQAVLVCHQSVFMVSRCRLGVPLSSVSLVRTSDVTGSDFVLVVTRNVLCTKMVGCQEVSQWSLH